MPPPLNYDPALLDLTRVIADQEALRRVNPQRFEMAQVTAIVHIDTEQHLIAGYKDVGLDEFWVRGHMPDYPLMPGVLMCEAAAQLCAYYITTQRLMPGDFMGFGGLENVRFRSPVRPGDRLVLVAKGVRMTRRQPVFNVQGFVGSTMVFHADILGVPMVTKGGSMSVRRTTRLPMEDLAPYLLDPPDPPAPLNWSAIFGNRQPVEMEIGFGKGLFLLTAAQACPAVNFLGVEVLRKYQLFTATRLAKRGLKNVRLVKADARLLLRDCVPEASLQAIHVYFPDPWWKKRHLKRRLFTPEFTAQCTRVLQPRGRLHVVTDVEDYDRVIKELVTTQAGLQSLPPPDPKEPSHDLDYLTNFERKFRKEGRAIYRGTWERVESAITQFSG